MHFLDLIMYFVIAVIIWYIILPDDFTEELGTIIGIYIMIVYTIIYVSIFVFCGVNWIDFSFNMQNFFKW